jgi:5-methylcytosine-specific restriction enzyme subunit McrC
LRLLVIVEGNATPILIGCDFDELSYNVLHNQILKATMLRLLRKQELAQECSDELAKLARQFSEIHDIQLSSRVLGQVQLPT